MAVSLVRLEQLTLLVSTAVAQLPLVWTSCAVCSTVEEKYTCFFFRSHFQVREGNAMWKLYTLTNGRTKNVSHLCSCSYTRVLCVLAGKKGIGLNTFA